MRTDDQFPATFTGGITGRWSFPATWPLGSLSITRERIWIRSRLGSALFPPVDRRREDVDEVTIRPAHLVGTVVEVVGPGGKRATTRFVPTNPGTVLTALDRFGWPTRVDGKLRRRAPHIVLALAMLLIGLGIGESVLKSGQAEELKARSAEVPSRIESERREGAKRHGVVRYEVDGREYALEIVLTSDRHRGDPVVVQYDPATPSRSWVKGDDPPGTDEWLFGPLGIVPGIVLLIYYRRQRGLARYFADGGGAGTAAAGGG